MKKADKTFHFKKPVQFCASCTMEITDNNGIEYVVNEHAGPDDLYSVMLCVNCASADVEEGAEEDKMLANLLERSEHQ